MTSNQVRGIPAETTDEQLVVQFLQHHPDFFERHPQLLARMRLQHPRNASTISARSIAAVRPVVSMTTSAWARSALSWARSAAIVEGGP